MNKTVNHIPLSDDEVRFLEFILAQVGGAGAARDISDAIWNRLMEFIPDMSDRQPMQLHLDNLEVRVSGYGMRSDGPDGNEGFLVLHEKALA